MSTTVQFTTTGSCSAFGNFGPGDLLRCGEGMARHLVEQAKVARYHQVRQPAAALAAADVAPTRSRKPRANAPVQQALDVGEPAATMGNQDNTK